MKQLSTQEIEEIRTACHFWQRGDGPRLAKKYGVSKSTISLYKLQEVGKRPMDLSDRSGGPDACWPWTGYLNALGYGQKYDPVRRAQMGAHRWVYEQEIGTIDSNLQLDHLCRNPACCNPKHLEPVTQKENIRRGTTPKLDVALVRAIKIALQAPYRGLASALAAKYGVCTSTIGDIKSGKTWNEVA
jgi:hypothetical protein